MKTSKRLLIVSGAICVTLVLLWNSKNNLDGIANDWLLEHPVIRFEDVFVGKVKSINNPPKLRQASTFVSVLFDEERKRTLDTAGDAKDHPDIFVRDVLLNGAFVEKKANSDTIKVTYQGVTYSFLIDKDD